MVPARVLSSTALAALLVVGCFGRSPTTRFYSLRAVSATESGRAATGEEPLAVRVGPAQMPSFLDRPQLARRTGESAIRYDEFNRWASGLGAELLRVVGANLAALLETDRIVVYPAEAPYPLDYRVVLDVERFEADPDDAVTLRARWAILPGVGGDAVSTGLTGARASASSGSADALVAAHSAAAGTLSRAIAERLRSLRSEAAASATAPAEPGAP
jgi:uncharacterized lipoprotein YmbA